MSTVILSTQIKRSENSLESPLCLGRVIDKKEMQTTRMMDSVKCIAECPIHELCCTARDGDEWIKRIMIIALPCRSTQQQYCPEKKAVGKMEQSST